MRSLRIRKFMVLGMLSIIIIPWISYFVVHFIDKGTFQPWYQSMNFQQNDTVSKVASMISMNYPQWQNPAWQSVLNTKLHNLGLEAVIYSPSGSIMYESNHIQHWMNSEHVSVLDGGKQMGMITLYSQGANDALASATALIVMVVVIVFAVGFQIRRNVIRPLEAMSIAARKVVDGELDFQLPNSHVTEIAEVRSAFTAMIEGLRKSIIKQTRMEDERRFFIGAIAHDLRTPLFALRGYLDGLQQGIANSPDKITKYIAVCKDKANHLDRLVADLFAYTKLEYMEQSLYYNEIDFEQIVQRSVESLRLLVQDKDISITMNSPDSVCVIHGDAHLLERAIHNLLDNASKHTPQGGDISIGWFQENNKTILSIRDTGPGFSPQDLDHIFEPFYRGDISRNSANGGAGLGLTIARRIFRAHGGDLQVENHESGGANLTGWIIG